MLYIYIFVICWDENIDAIFLCCSVNLFNTQANEICPWFWLQTYCMKIPKRKWSVLKINVQTWNKIVDSIHSAKFPGRMSLKSTRLKMWFENSWYCLLFTAGNQLCLWSKWQLPIREEPSVIIKHSLKRAVL